MHRAGVWCPWRRNFTSTAFFKVLNPFFDYFTTNHSNSINYATRGTNMNKISARLNFTAFNLPESLAQLMDFLQAIE